MEDQRNNPSLFPHLNQAVLKSFAHTWAASFTFMEKIVLYRPSVLESRKKYLLHFELSEISEAEGFNENDKSFVDLLKGPDALIWLGTGNKFKDVYTGKPDDDFFKEWAFVTELPEYTDQENKWVLYEKKYRADSRQKTLRPSQRHKKAVCEIAADLWKKDPSITIAKMIERQEIIDVSEKENGDCYLEKTLRDWIKDLCPNRKPGRRPK